MWNSQILISPIFQTYENLTNSLPYYELIIYPDEGL